MSRPVVGYLLTIILWLSGTNCNASEIEIKPKQNTGSSRVVSIEPTSLRLTGLITTGDADRLKKILVDLKSEAAAFPMTSSLVTIELSSLGGDLYEGLKVGYVLRDFDVATVVRTHDICLSSCALAFLGGTMRHGPFERIGNQSLEIGGKVGFHRFWLNPYSNQLSASGDPAQTRAEGFEVALSGAAAVMRYAADLNIDFKFIARTMAKPSEHFEYLNTAEEFLALNVCPIGLRRPEINPEQQALNICNHSMGGANRLGTSRITQMTPLQAKRYMLENVQKNMLLLKVNGALSTQLASYSVMREQPGIDSLYADMQAAGVRLPKIVGPVFEVAGYQTSEGETQCFVSLSLDDPNQFEVAIRRPKIWAHPSRSAPRQCRGLFLHDKEATINARP